MASVGLRATAGSKTLSYGLVQVRVGMMPALDDQARLRAKMVDPDTLGPVKQQYVNELGDVVKPAKAYPYGDTLVELPKDSTDALKALSDGVIALEANLDSVPDELVEKTYLLWPTDGASEQPFKMLATYLEHTGHVLVGKTHAGGTTKAFALRYSKLYGGMVAQLLSYYERVRWDAVQMVRHAVSEMQQPDAPMQEMANQIFDSMPSEIDWAEMRDEYGAALEQAVADAAAGRGTPAPADIVELIQSRMREAEHV